MYLNLNFYIYLFFIYIVYIYIFKSRFTLQESNKNIFHSASLVTNCVSYIDRVKYDQ